MRTLLWSLPNTVFRSLHHCCWEFQTLGTTTDPSLLPQLLWRLAATTTTSQHQIQFSIILASLYHLLQIQHLKQEHLIGGVLPAKEAKKVQFFSFHTGRWALFLPKTDGVRNFLNIERCSRSKKKEREKKKKTNVHSTLWIKISVGEYSMHYGALLLSPQFSPLMLSKTVLLQNF